MDNKKELSILNEIFEVNDAIRYLEETLETKEDVSYFISDIIKESVEPNLDMTATIKDFLEGGK